MLFIGRKNELQELQNIYGNEGFQMVLIYGEFGTGKTTLLEEFCKDKDTIFFTAKHESNRANLIKFSKKVLEYYEDRNSNPFSFWEQALSYIKSKQAGKKIIIVIDNFSYIAERDPVFSSVLCKSADNELRDSNIILFLTSDNESFIQKNILAMNEPIAQKLTAKIRLDKFLNEETIAKLQEEAMKRSRGIDRTKFIRAKADDIVQREGATGSYMYKIVSGTAICYLNYGTDKEYLIGRLKEGASFGEYQLLTGKPAPYTVVAFSDMLLLRIGRGEFRRFIEMNTTNAIDIMRVQSKMIAALRFHVDLLFDEVKS